MNYIGNIPEFNIVHGNMDRFDYVNPNNPAIDTNPPILYSTWLNTTSGETFICIDNTGGVNVWRGSSGSIINSVTDALVHRYPLNKNLDDVVGVANGSFHGNFYIRDRLYFSGTDGEYVLLSPNCWGLSTAWAVSLMVYADYTQTGHAPFFHVTNSDGDNVFAWWFRGDDVMTELTFNSISSGVIDIGLHHSQEYHIVMTSDGFAYVDGAQISIPNVTAVGDLTLGTQFILGSDVDNGPVYNNALDGTIRDVRIYNRALTQAEVTALYNECV